MADPKVNETVMFLKIRNVPACFNRQERLSVVFQKDFSYSRKSATTNKKRRGGRENLNLSSSALRIEFCISGMIFLDKSQLQWRDHTAKISFHRKVRRANGAR